MEIENEKGIFDLEKNSAISIERTNPLFNEQGSMSLPFSIKRTSKNDYLLDFPHKYERKNVFEVKRDVNIRSGLLNENASLEILSVDSKKVESVFYLYESSFYSQAKEVKLSQVFDGIERWFQPKKELTDEERKEYVSHIIDMFEEMMFSPVNDDEDFTIFPAVVDCELNIGGSSRSLPTAQSDSRNFFNEILVSYETGEMKYKLNGSKEYTYKDDEGNDITVPVGYAITPFFKLRYVLKKIFEYFGFTLEPTIFDTTPEYRNIVVMNNTMDAIMPGYFIESQLVPDCTINEFLDMIRNSFCGDFFIDVPSKTARLALFNDVIASPPDQDMTKYLSSDFENLELNKPKQVKLTIKKSLPYASTTTGTLNEFIEKYSDYFGSTSELINDEGIYPFYMQNSIWKVYNRIEGAGMVYYKKERLSSMNFDYVTKDNIETEEHAIPSEAPASVYVRHRYTDLLTYAPVIGSKRNLNSFVIINGKKQEEDTPECPLILSLEYFRSFCRVGLQTSMCRAEEQPPAGEPESSLLLWGESGLFARHWKNYDNLLRTSFIPITHKLKLPAYILKNFSFDKLKIINGQPMIPISLKYSTDDCELIDVEIQLLTVKAYTEEVDN